MVLLVFDVMSAERTAQLAPANLHAVHIHYENVTDVPLKFVTARLDRPFVCYHGVESAWTLDTTRLYILQSCLVVRSCGDTSPS